MTEPEAAKFLKKGLSTLRALRREQKVPHLPGKPATYLRSSLIAWLQAQEVQPSAAPIKPTKRSTTYLRNDDKAALRAAILP